jgi:hypothetical protein
VATQVSKIRTSCIAGVDRDRTTKQTGQQWDSEGKDTLATPRKNITLVDNSNRGITVTNERAIQRLIP